MVRDHARGVDARLVVAVSVALMGAGCAGAGGGQRSARHQGGTSIEAEIGRADALPPEAFVALSAPAELGPLLGDVAVWWDRFFRPEASPRRAATVAFSARAAGDGAPDLVRATYEMAVARLDVLDGSRFTLIRVADPGVDVAEGAAAQVIMRRVLAFGPDRTWGIRLPDRLQEGVWYASATGGVDDLNSYRDRIDARVVVGRLELLCHKRGEGPRPASGAWLPPELRARLTVR